MYPVNEVADFFSLLKSELERKIRANNREYNLSFKYAVSIDAWCCVQIAAAAAAALFGSSEIFCINLHI